MNSIDRVKLAASRAQLQITIRQMPESTRTAPEAAKACGCEVEQIVKSMIFEDSDTGKLKLLLVSGVHKVNLEKAVEVFGEELKRADPKRVREITGFAIGGVAPIGHLSELETWMDSSLLHYETVWAAAGAPNAVFKVNPDALIRATGARKFII